MIIALLYILIEIIIDKNIENDYYWENQHWKLYFGIGILNDFWKSHFNSIDNIGIVEICGNIRISHISVNFFLWMN